MIILPEFDKSLRVDEQAALIFEGPSRYDIIFGQDFLCKTGMKVDYNSRTVEWMRKTIPLKTNMEINEGLVAYSLYTGLLDLNEAKNEENDNQAQEKENEDDTFLKPLLLT